MPSKYKKGFLSNYCGPGGEGSYQHQTDALCAWHDAAYGEMEEGGLHPYRFYSSADEEFQNKLKKRRHDLIHEMIHDAMQGFPNKKQNTKEFAINVLSDAYFGAKSWTKNMAGPHMRHVIEDDEKMEDASEVVADAAGATADVNMMAIRSSETSLGRDETKVTPAAPTYGLPETHTTILPLDMYFSMVLQKDSDFAPGIFEVAQTSIVNPIMTEITAAPSSGSFTRGIYNRPVPNAGSSGTWADVGYFPYTFGAGNKKEKAFYQQWFEIQYQYYSVLGSEWELTVSNCGLSDDEYFTVYTADQCYGVAANNTIPDTTKLWQIGAYKGVRKHILPADGAGNWTTSAFSKIRGTYKPGQARFNVLTDDLTKTWTAIDSNPALTESVKFFFYPGELSGGLAARTLRINCKFTIKYIVQFKDLRGDYRYPGTASTSVLSPGDLSQKWDI